METAVVMQGRRLGEQELREVRELICGHPDWNRKRLAIELARAWNWRTLTGRVKDMAAFSLLLKLDGRGWITLPPRRRPATKRIPRVAQRLLPLELECPLKAELGEVTPVVIELVAANHPRFRRYLAEEHYLGYGGPVGEHLAYLIRGRSGRALACVLFGAAAWKVAPRDHFIGWDPAVRAQRLSFLTNNTRLKAGMRCPGCERGKLCSLPSGKLLRITAMPPLQATVHQPERLRCATCGEVYTAEVPPEVGPDKFDESACSMVALFRYGYGLPLNRLANFQKGLGMPLPVGTQWMLITRVSQAAGPVFEHLLDSAAQGQVFYNDDTNMKVLSLMKEEKEAKKKGEALERTGMFTTGIVAIVQGRKVLLFFSGRKHAGENLEELLRRREQSQTVPLQMCDAMSRNEPSTAPTVVANCLTHGRRQFYDVYTAFPEQVKFVIGTLKEVYRNEAMTKKGNMSDRDRLAFHQENSAPHMDNLKAWMEEQSEEKKVEPHSSLGKAIQYMKNHWEKLTRFLKVQGAPLTNDECERLIKTAIRHRKNSLFYKNESGARVGDSLMSVIQTAQAAGINPFDYLCALQKHQPAVSKNPDQWLPWNYQDTLKPRTPDPAGSSP